MSRSLFVSFFQGTSVLTPMSLAISFIKDHIRDCQGATAPSSMLRESSGMMVAMSISLMTPVPSQRAQAPWELKASSSAPGAKKVSPQTGHTSDLSAATFRLGFR